MLKYIKSGDILLLRLFNTRIKCRVLDAIMPVITYLGSVQFSLMYCMLALISPSSSIVHLGVKTSGSLTISTIIVQLLKRKIIRIRPFEVLENLYIKKVQIDPYSFPSGHTAAAFSMAISATLLFPTLGLLYIALATTVAISRMYLGVHYPSDVVVAAIIAIISVFVVNILANNYPLLFDFML